MEIRFGSIKGVVVASNTYAKSEYLTLLIGFDSKQKPLYTRTPKWYVDFMVNEGSAKVD